MKVGLKPFHWGASIMSLGALNSENKQRILKFLLTGCLNTAFGFSIILALIAVGVSDILANLAGFCAGLILSFFVNRHWTFSQKDRPTSREIILFVSVFGIAYICNLMILVAGQRLGYSGNPLLHFSAVASYSAITFILAQRFIYNRENQITLSPTQSSAVIVIFCCFIALLIIPGMPITHDVVWQLWIARQLNNGVHLYTQINEVNPPLWFWMAMPVDALATKINASAIVAMQITIIFLCGISTLLAGRLLPAMTLARRSLFLVNAFTLGLLISLGNFAQREQIAMLVSLPYCLMIVRRVQGEKVSIWLALMVGLLASGGFALKHFFVAVPLLLELWLLLSRRRQYRPFRPETLILASGALMYAAAIWKFAPDFFALQLPMVTTAYGGYSMPFLALLVGQEQLIWMACIIVFLLNGWFQSDRKTPLIVGLLLTTAGFAFSFAAQQKGWVYHSMPVTYFLMLATIASVIYNWNHNLKRIGLFAALLALAIGYWVPVASGEYNSRFAEATNAALAGSTAGETVYIFSSDAQQSWPMIVEGGFLWPSRFMSLWMLPAIGAGLGDPQKLSVLSKRVLAMTVEDLQCNPPDSLLIARKTINRTLGPLRFDFRQYFLSDRSAVQLMTQYDLVRTNSRFYTYRRKPAATIPRPANCRKIY